MSNETTERPQQREDAKKKKDYPICADCENREMFTSICSSRKIKVDRRQSACKEDFLDKRPKRN